MRTIVANCQECRRDLHEGDTAWASDVKIVERGRWRAELRYVCDECEGARNA